MDRPINRRLACTLGAAATAAALLTAVSARAEDWPTRPVTMIVPFPAGGNVDVAARQVAKAAPDGYTLLLTATGPAVFNKLLYKSIPYDPDTDFTPIIITNDVPQVLIVDPKLPIRTLADLQEFAKKKPGGISIGHAGP